MERYRSAPNLEPTFQASLPPYISLPPKPIHSHLRPATTPRDRLGRRADDTEISIFDAERYFNGAHSSHAITNRRTIILDGVAERCHLSANPRGSSVDGYARKDGSFHTTPTVTSEASWNSQSGLLMNPPGSVLVNARAFPHHERRSGPSSSRRRLFRRNCPCSGKKSVDVEEKCSEPNTPIRSNHDIGFWGSKKQSSKTGDEESSEPPKSPIRSNHDRSRQSCRAGEEKMIDEVLGIEEVRKLKLVAGNWSKDQEVAHNSSIFSPEKQLPAEIGRRIVNSGRPFNNGFGFSFPILALPATDLQEDHARDSLEVFQPTEEMPTLREPAEFQRRVAGDLQSFTSRPAYGNAASDTSSDLFEIESFSTQMTYRRRDSLDELSQGGFDQKRFVGATAGILEFRRSLEEEASAAATPSIAPSECYPPSEVSVEWSVTTAEGFDRGSVANFSTASSEYEELRFIQAENRRYPAAVDGVGKRRGSGLLSCVSEKAVCVGPTPVQLGPEHSGRARGIRRSNPTGFHGWQGY